MRDPSALDGDVVDAILHLVSHIGAQRHRARRSKPAVDGRRTPAHYQRGRSQRAMAGKRLRRQDDRLNIHRPQLVVTVSG